MSAPDVAAAIETVRLCLRNLDSLVAHCEALEREREELIAEKQRWMTEGFLGPRDAKELMIEKQDAERRVEELEGQLREIESGLWPGAVRDFARRALEEEQA